jgi:hypothetical protein
MKKPVFVYFVSFVVIRNLRTLYKSYLRDLLRVLRASVVKNPDYRRYATSILRLHKVSQNHSHSRGSTNIGAQNAFSPCAYALSTIHRHTAYANASPDDQIPIIEKLRASCCFWHSVARATSKTRKLQTVRGRRCGGAVRGKDVGTRQALVGSPQYRLRNLGQAKATQFPTNASELTAQSSARKTPSGPGRSECNLASGRKLERVCGTFFSTAVATARIDSAWLGSAVFASGQPGVGNQQISTEKE